jgi:ferritin-like metal-binding protein YciE
MKTKLSKTLQNKIQFNGVPVNKGMQSSQLMELFEDQLKDINWAEKALVKAIPKMISKASSEDLIVALSDHLDQTNEQVTRLAKVFEIIGKKPSSKKCDAMDGLITEGQDIMDSCEKGPQCDAGIITMAQKIEHYEIASYGTLREFAATLGFKDAEKLLLKTLTEEKASDKKLTEVAVETVNLDAAVTQA